MSTGAKFKYQNTDNDIELSELPGRSGTNQLEVHRLHYPEPQTFSR